MTEILYCNLCFLNLVKIWEGKVRLDGDDIFKKTGLLKDKALDDCFTEFLFIWVEMNFLIQNINSLSAIFIIDKCLNPEAKGCLGGSVG